MNFELLPANYKASTKQEEISDPISLDVVLTTQGITIFFLHYFLRKR